MPCCDKFFKSVFMGVWIRNGALLQSDLNPAWHFWFSTRFSWCLKMTIVEFILGYFRKNLWNCLREYPNIFKTDFILTQQEIEL